MDNQEFRRYAHELVDWMADYLDNVRRYPVKAQVQPKEIIAQLPEAPPQRGEPFERIFGDFEKIIVPGMTHWQHPSFFAYFPANSSPPSVLAEMLMSTLAAQCMSWQTSPAATELEERVMQWLGQMIGLPREFIGVIQDTASTATLCSLLTAREKYSDFAINARGFDGSQKFAVYCSTETHSSIEKAVKIAGLGSACLRKVAVDEAFALKPAELEKLIAADRHAGVTPLAVVATIGTTGSTAIDPLRAIGEICRREEIWLHVDAAFAGTALILPELRWMIEGIEYVDTFVFNPHKWMFTNFDCTAYFVRDPAALVRTFEILPEYLKTAEGDRVNNYRDWGIQLGRRFRALKLWFVIRSYGVAGLQLLVREQLELARGLAAWIGASADFELLAPTHLNLVCFRYHPAGVNDPGQLNVLNERLLERVNATGKAYMTHTKLNGAYTLRMVIAQTQVTHADVKAAWELIKGLARGK
ncbi:MAG: aminotransferase class V-fold PLP-dependent enzyme [candidate division Zixibacteria bacterium]|nr:aminotransferase class V-fold PLP-dependent enzyme [candidate division Zixibacteria bacterium]